MRHLFLLGFLTLIGGAKSAFALEVVCASPSGESLLLLTTPTRVVLSYENERGPEFTPIEDGPVRETLGDFYKMAYDDLKDVLDGFAVEWQPQECQINLNFWLSSCGGKSKLISDPKNETGVQATGVYLSQLTETGASGDQVTYRFRLSFEKDGNTYFVPLYFAKDFCKGSKL